MLLSLLFLTQLRSTMNSRSAVKCEDLRKMTQSQKEEICQALDLPSHYLNNDVQAPSRIGIRYLSYVDAHNYSNSLISYNLTAKMSSSQFFYHGSLSRQLLSKLFFNIEEKCFIDKKWGYRIYKYDRNTEYYINRVRFSTLDQLNQNFLSAIEIFRTLENNNAIFLERLETFFIIFKENEIRFFPEIIAQIFSAKDVQDKTLDSTFTEGRVYLSPGFGGASRGFFYEVKVAKIKSDLKSLWHFFEHCIRIKKFNSKFNSIEFEGEILEELDYNFYKFREVRDSTDNDTHTWKEWVEFIKTWGHQETFMKKLKKQKLKI